MTVLVIGSENTGKSDLAEKLAVNTGDKRRYYLATMKTIDEAGRARIEKHRKKREGKGFITIEQEHDIADAVEELEMPEEATVLLECVSNLVGNEMHDSPERSRLLLKDEPDYERFSEGVAADIRYVAEKVRNLIMVTNDYSADMDRYDEETKKYVKVLNMVNERIKVFSDKSIDVREGQEIESI